MSQSVEALENQFVFMRGTLAAFKAQHATPDQITELQTQIALCRKNYLTAATKTLQDDDPVVQGLVLQMNRAQLTLDANLKHLNDVAKVLDAITKAVDIGTKLAAKVLAL